VVHLIKLLSRSPVETKDVGEHLGRYLVAGDVVALNGVLGSGKSVLARGILRGLGVGGEIPSPSFIIVASYEGRLPVNHIDLYRLGTHDEAVAIGLDDLLYSDAVSVIEWAEKVTGLLPPSRVEIAIQTREAPDERVLTIVPSDPATAERLTPLAEGLIDTGVS
jgi:tRNA threonylcarbamoyladenosine biosynthesis protein TsaE